MDISERYFPGFKHLQVEVEPGITINTFVGGEGKEAGRIHRLNNPASGVDMVCPDCGAETHGAKFCPQCGKKLAVKRFCTDCGAEASSEAKFCPECGKSMQG